MAAPAGKQGVVHLQITACALSAGLMPCPGGAVGSERFSIYFGRICARGDMKRDKRSRRLAGKKKCSRGHFIAKFKKSTRLTLKGERLEAAF